MTPSDLDRIERDALSQNQLQLARTIIVTPGHALELCRLARIGMETEALLASQSKRLHQDDGA